MDMRIAGSGKIGSGEYDNISISGSGKLEAPIRCSNMNCVGSAHCNGVIEASDTITASGSVNIEGDLRSGRMRISGSGKIDGSCTVREEIKVAGAFCFGGNVKANKFHLTGSCHAESIEAEEVHTAGKIVCNGLLNAEKLEIIIDGTGSEIGSIGGSIIEIKRKKRCDGIKFLFFKIKKKERGYLKVKDLIEGDEITIDYVEANTVIGRIVRIGPGCRINRVQYSEGVEIHPDAEVSEQIKI